MEKEIRKNTYSIIVIILFILSIGFAITTFRLIGVLNKSNQTYIGTIAISNYEEDQYANIIASNLHDWKEDSNHIITYQNLDLTINLDLFEADIDSTINQLRQNEINKVVYVLSNANRITFAQELRDFYSVDIIDIIDVDKLVSDIISDIEVMSNINKYDLKNYFGDGVENTILSSITMINLDANDVTSITNAVASLDIDEESRFFLLEAVEDLTLNNNQLSILASGIQAVTMNSNLNSFIFEQNTVLPSWSLEGLNVRILKANSYDFSFYNDFNYSMSISVTKNDDNSITYKLIGYPYSCDYATANIEVASVDFITVYEENETIIDTTPGVIATETDEDYIYRLLSQTGVNGKIMKFERTITYPNATTQKVTLYYEEFQQTNEIYQENIVSKGGE